MNIALWIAQIVLAAGYALFGWMKTTMPLGQLGQMMNWVPDYPAWFVRGLGVAEILGAIGLVLPWLLRIQPRLTVLAAICILAHQACAVALHLSKGEADKLGLNVVLIALAAFIAWDRSRKSTIAAGAS